MLSNISHVFFILFETQQNLVAYFGQFSVNFEQEHGILVHFCMKIKNKERLRLTLCSFLKFAKMLKLEKANNI